MESQQPWRWLVGLGICAVLGWYAFVRETNVPLLSYVDLGFHELGHLLTYPFPDVVTAAMGSITQVLVPWGLATYFFVFRRDALGGVFCMTWAATSLQNASIYVADAPYQSLQLIGGEHDWAFVLGPDHFDALDKADEIASAMKGLGGLILFGATAMCLVGLYFSSRRSPDQPAKGRTD
ncbi:MAG: hypothetical protein QOG54_888 [Actinomycetota bacterium]|nr:hypothetical protein [Actinomycetota bacterium]